MRRICTGGELWCRGSVFTTLRVYRTNDRCWWCRNKFPYAPSWVPRGTTALLLVSCKTRAHEKHVYLYCRIKGCTSIQVTKLYYALAGFSVCLAIATSCVHAPHMVEVYIVSAITWGNEEEEKQECEVLGELGDAWGLANSSVTPCYIRACTIVYITRVFNVRICR